MVQTIRESLKFKIQVCIVFHGNKYNDNLYNLQTHTLGYACTEQDQSVYTIHRSFILSSIHLLPS